MLSLAKKTAIVSGGSKGIGKAIAMKLAQADANVVICSRKKKILILRLMKQIKWTHFDSY